MHKTWPLLLLLACSSTPSEPKGAGGTGGKPPCTGSKCPCPTGKSWDDFAASCMAELPAPVCHPTSQWTGAQPAFHEPAGDWGLGAYDQATDLHVTGGDVDGDGWLDMVIDGSTMTLLHNNHAGFDDVTQSSGFAAPRSGSTPRAGGAVVFADVDNDGDLDAFTAFNNTDDPVQTSEIVLNDGHGHFSLGPTGQPYQVHTIPFASAAFTDYDRDGYVDLWAGALGDNFTPFQNHLLHGGPGGLFTDVTEEAGLKTRLPSTANVDQWNQGLDHAVTWAVGACDLNGDGTPELIASSYGRQPNHLWLGKRDATGNVSFINRSVVSGYAYDARMNWQEDESVRCYCKFHPDTSYCEGVPTDAIRIRCREGHDEDWGRWDPTYGREPFELGGNSATSVCSDFNGDGWMDILTGTIVHWDVGSGSDPSEILYNKQDPYVVFDRPGNDVTGMVRPHAIEAWNDGDMTNAVLDFDNDGRPDILIGSAGYPGTRAWLFHQKPDGKFELVPTPLAIDMHSVYGVIVGDFDRDGGLDVVAAHSEIRCTPPNPTDQCYTAGNKHPRIFQNVLGTTGNWMQLRLEGIAGTNRSAIGARVTVEADGLTQTQEVEGGHGHYGMQNDQVLHFGLGAACSAKVTVRWPNAALTTERFTVGSGHRYHVVQGAGPVADDP